MNQETQNTEATSDMDYRGRAIGFYHANARNTGSAMRLEARVNRSDQDRYNCFFLEMAQQKSAPGRDGDRRVAGTFDWRNKITVKLDFLDVCEFLTVLEGRANAMGGSRGGLYHATQENNTLISLKRDAERGNYFLSLSRKRGQEEAQRVGIALSEVEATGIRCLFQTGLFLISFHGELFPRRRSVATSTRVHAGPPARI